MDAGQPVVGIDIAASRPCVAVAVRGGRTLEVEGWWEADGRARDDRARLLDWVVGLRSVAVGVAAPQRPARALPGGGRRPRSCDADLARRRVPVYQVPTRAEAAAGARHGWVRVGWDMFRDLGRRGYELPAPGALPGALGQAQAALEVYPHASFAALLGGSPPPKSGRDGLHARVTVLQAAGVTWSGFYDHASLDALATALTAWRFMQGLATPVGDERDGFIWLPVPAQGLRDRYPRLTAAEAVAAAQRVTRR